MHDEGSKFWDLAACQPIYPIIQSRIQFNNQKMRIENNNVRSKKCLRRTDISVVRTEKCLVRSNYVMIRTNFCLVRSEKCLVRTKIIVVRSNHHLGE